METVRCWKLICGRDIGWRGKGVGGGVRCRMLGYDLDLTFNLG